MSKILTRTYRPRYAEINADGWLAPADYARYILDTAYAWGESLGLGEADSTELGLYWVIRETEISFFSPLRFQEDFDFTIWMLDWKRVRGTRAFVLKRKDTRAAIAQGVQQIACMDIRTQRPASPPEHLIDNFRLDAPAEMPSTRFPRVPPPPAESLTLKRAVAWADLDTLEIVNNAVYIAYAEDALAQLFAACGWSPPELKAHGLSRWVRRLHIQYHAPAVWGDRLSLTAYTLALDPAGGSLCVAMTRLADGAPIATCILDWALIDRAGFAPHPLPASLAAALKPTLGA
jgi:YbgC/YbaW family acyl-CoA thioester hydrolase